jgi:DNA-binding response OmpR family regulator
MGRILFIEADEPCAAHIVDRLTLSEHDVRVVGGERCALSTVDEWEPDVVILDPMNRTAEGGYLIRTIRRRAPTTRLVAIGRDNTETAAVLALRMGADDYLGQPLRMLEFLARVDAQLRRMNAPSSSFPTTEIRGVMIDRAARQVLKQGRPVALAPCQFDMLDVLFARAGAVVSREDLQRVLSEKSLSAASRAVDQHIMQLRRKLEPEPPSQPLIETVRGVGYRISRRRRSQMATGGPALRSAVCQFDP